MVQHLDGVATKLLFENDGSKNTAVPKRKSILFKNVSKVLKDTFPAADGFGDEERGNHWLIHAVELKQKLMISNRDYRVHTCRPGTKFDPSWMEAEDVWGCSVKDQQAEGIDVVQCTLPALVQQELEPLARDAPVAAALACNKKFYPSRKEKKAFDPATFDPRARAPNKVISKAVALVEYPQRGLEWRLVAFMFVFSSFRTVACISLYPFAQLSPSTEVWQGPKSTGSTL
jgi:hypothetical protein